VKEFIQKINLKDPLVSGSLLVLTGSFAVNILSYLFQLLVGRMLSVSEYGILISLFSLVAIVNIPAVVVNTSIVKIVSELKAKEDYASVSGLFLWLFKAFLVFGLIVLVLSFLLGDKIVRFLNFSDTLLFLVFMLFFVSVFVLSIPLSFLQGLHKFKEFSIVNFVSAFNKLFFGIGVTFFTYKVIGTVWGIFAGALVSLLVSLLIVKDAVLAKASSVSFWIKKLAEFAVPSSISLIALAILFNVDVVLVKHFFDDHTSGIYSSLAIIGRILFFGTSSIGLVLFPLSSSSHAKGRDTKGIFAKSLFLTSFLLMSGFVVFYFFPALIVEILFGPAYYLAVPYLGKFSIFMIFYTLIYLFTQYFLSIYKTKVGIVLALGSLTQILLIWVRHGSLTSVIENLICVNAVLFVLLAGLWIYQLSSPATSRKRQ